MARKGRFGRARGRSTNLTLLIAQLIREQRAAEDRAIADAYKNGGSYKGEPVTDARYLAHLRSRRDGFTKDDPLWDQWNNSVVQQEFSIGEEKIGLAFKQGKVGAGAVASYYRSQLAKLPKDSAFYREVAGRAADWAKYAAGAARGAARGRLSAALEKKGDAAIRVQSDHLALEAAIERAARDNGLVRGTDDLTDADASELMALFGRGIVGPTGELVSFEDWQDATRASYAAFDTRIAVNKQLNRGTIELKEGKARFFDTRLVKLNAVDDRVKWEAAQDIFFGAIEDSGNDPAAILAAADKYAATLETLHAQAIATGLDRNDPDHVGGLVNEIASVVNGKAPGLALSDLFGEGVIGPNGQRTTLAAVIAETKANADLLQSGKAFFGQSEFGGPLAVIKYGLFASLDPFGKSGLDDSWQKAVLRIGGKAKVVLMKGQAVVAAGLKDSQGMPVSSIPVADGKGGTRMVTVGEATPQQIANALAAGIVTAATDTEQPLGYVFSNPANGQMLYGVTDQNGDVRLTANNPFGGTYSLEGIDQPAVIVAGAFDPIDGSKVVPDLTNALRFAVEGTAGLYVDSSVSSRDLAAFDELAATPVERQALAEVAAKRAYMERDTRRGYGYQTAEQFDFGKWLGNTIEQAQGPIAETAGAIGGIVGTLFKTPLAGALGPPSPSPLGAPPTITPPTVRPGLRPGPDIGGIDIGNPPAPGLRPGPDIGGIDIGNPPLPPPGLRPGPDIGGIDIGNPPPKKPPRRPGRPPGTGELEF